MNSRSLYATKPERYFGDQRRELVEFLPGSAETMLDVGCGAGAFGAHVKQIRKIEVHGVEPIQAAAACAAKKLDKVYIAPFDGDLALPEGYFDVITFNDVLEHFMETGPPLLHAKRLLSKEGVIVCSIPNVRYFEHVKHYLIEADWQYKDDGVLDNSHLRFFTKKSMLRTFDELGFQVLRIEGINPTYWNGLKTRVLRLLFGRYIEDMKYMQFVSVLKPRA